MERKHTLALLKKIDRILENLKQVRQSIAHELGEPVAVRKRRASSTATLVSDDDFKREYQQLRERFAAEGRRAVQVFVQGHPVSYIDRFIAVNNLPVPTREAKALTEELLTNCLAQSLVIRGG